MSFNIANKKITIIGLQKSGVAAAQLASMNGANVFVSDLIENEITKKNYIKLTDNNIKCEIGKHTNRIFESELWVVSPGVPKNIKIIKKAQFLGIKIIGEIEFANMFTNLPIIAVTGSNGKSTTVSIIYDMLKNSNYEPILAGNIGIPFSSAVKELNQKLIKGNIFILEVSSFQLEFIDQFHPYISLFLNISPDHLDRHKNMAEYVRAKLSMVKNMTNDDFIIFNKEDESLNTYFKNFSVKTIAYGLKSDNKFFSTRNTTLYDSNNEPFLELRKIRLKGQHNLSNLIASATIAKILNIDGDSIKNTMKNFEGIEHRLEFIRKFSDVIYINDSKATNLSSVIAALNSFESPIILLLGGKNKDSNFRQLLPHTRRHVKHIVSFGEAGGEIATALGDAVRLKKTSSLSQAVASAHKVASPGDVVLMSPGCASFDQFKSFEQRGTKFKELVNRL